MKQICSRYDEGQNYYLIDSHLLGKLLASVNIFFCYEHISRWTFHHVAKIYDKLLFI